MGALLEYGDLDSQFSMYETASSEQDEVSFGSEFDPLDHEVGPRLQDRTPEIRRRRLLA
jgi:hypothetical protein